MLLLLSGFLSGLAAGLVWLFLVWYGFWFDLASYSVWLLVWCGFWSNLPFGLIWLLVWSGFLSGLASDLVWLMVWALDSLTGLDSGLM